MLKRVLLLALPWLAFAYGMSFNKRFLMPCNDTLLSNLLIRISTELEL